MDVHISNEQQLNQKERIQSSVMLAFKINLYLIVLSIYFYDDAPHQAGCCIYCISIHPSPYAGTFSDLFYPLFKGN